MPRVEAICEYLELQAPSRLAENWDNVGLLLGRRDVQVNRLMTCLTLTWPVALEAESRNVQMIVTHHPLLFRAARRITDETHEGKVLLKLLESGIAVYSPHTAFDSSENGINQHLAEKIGLQEIAALRPAATSGLNIPRAESPDDRSGSVCPEGAGRAGRLSGPMQWLSFLQRISEVTGADYLEYHWSGSPVVERVGIGCGSAAEFIGDAVKIGCDTFVTGEARFHAVLDAQASGISLILTGHYCSERPGVEQLASRLQRRFPEVDCFASQRDENPLSVHRSDRK